MAEGVEEKTEESAVVNDEVLVYELGYNVVPTVTEEKLPTVVGEIKGILEKQGAVFLMEEFPSLISLAYTMIKSVASKKERYDSAYFGWVKFELTPEALLKAKEGLDTHESLLRFLIIKTVREDTRAPKRLTTPKLEEVTPKESRVISKPEEPISEEKEKKGVISDEELDKTIDELVVE